LTKLYQLFMEKW